MRFKTIVTAFSCSLALVACGTPFGDVAGTGQSGEAKIIGIAMTSTGTIAANQMLTVADQNYVAKKSGITNRAGTIIIDTIVTDQNGKFTVTLLPGQTVTISGRINNDFMYVPSVHSSKGNSNLGNIQFKPGVAVKVYPWWNKDNVNDKFTVKGTDFGYTIPDDSVSTIFVPSGLVNLVHYDQTKTETITVNGANIGDSTKWDTTKDRKFFKITGTKEVRHLQTIELKPPYNSRGYFSLVMWGDSTGPDTALYESSTSHWYAKPGIYAVSVSVFEFDTISNLFNFSELYESEIDTILIADSLLESPEIEDRSTNWPNSSKGIK